MRIRILFCLGLLAISCSRLRTPTSPKEEGPKTPSKEALAAIPPDANFSLWFAAMAPKKEVIYLMLPGDTVGALDLKAGKALWTSNEAAKPLFASDDALLAQRGASLVVLDPNNGKLLRECKSPVSLPRIDAELGYQGVTLSEARAGRLYIFWSWQTWYSGGAPPPKEVEEAARKSDAGALLIETAGCSAQASKERAPTLGPELIVRGEDRQDSLILESGESKRIKTTGNRYVSADRRHVVTIEQAPASKGEFNYRWTIYSRVDGAEVASFVTADVTYSFFVWRDKLLYIPGNKAILRAILLKDGSPIWSTEIRDISLKGPFPP